MPVDGSGSGYLKSVCDYVHLNPARAKLISSRQKLSHFRWSSYPQYLKERSLRPTWPRVDRLLGEHGIPKDSPTGRQHFERRLELRRATEDGEEFLPLQRGWCVGSEAFRQERLAQMKAGSEHLEKKSASRESRRPGGCWRVNWPSWVGGNRSCKGGPKGTRRRSE